MDEKAVLRAEVEALQSKLQQVTTGKQKLTEIAHHVQVIKIEATRLEALVHEVEPEIFTPEFVAAEFSKAAAVGGAGWVLYKIVKSIQPLPVKARSWLGGGLAVATAVIISWRFASSSVGRFASAFFDHRRRKKAFLKELKELQHRVGLLQALLAGSTEVQQSTQPAVQPSPQPAAAGAAAAAGAVAGESGTASGTAAGSSNGNGGREQFVVVDLPRVESGGFVLASPAPSPPPAPLAAAAAAALPPLHPGPAGSSAAAGATAAPSSSARQLLAAGPFAVPSQQGSGPFAASAQQGVPLLPARPGVPKAQAADSIIAGSVQQDMQAASTAQVAGFDAKQQAGQLQAEKTQPSSHGAAGAGDSSASSPGYEIPDSVMKAGWGGVLQQQQQQAWQPPPPQGQQQQPAAGAVPGWGTVGHAQQQQQQQSSPASRQWSSGTEVGDEGELVDQPSDAEEAVGSRRAAGQLVGGGAAAAAGAGEPKAGGSQVAPGGLQRGSPASSSSEDAVLLERE